MRFRLAALTLGLLFATASVGCSAEPSPDADPVTGNYVGTGDDRRLRSDFHGLRREDSVRRNADGQIDGATIRLETP